MKALSERLQALESEDRRRQLFLSEGVPLTDNDVLGLASRPEVAAALVGALQRGLPTGGRGSRLLGGNHPDWEALEARVARWQGREAALYFSTGYAANVGLLACLPEPGELIVSDSLNHASLIDGARLSRARRVVVPHGDVAAAARAIDGPAYVVVESVYSMDGDLAPLEDYAALCQRTGARLIVDEAHATGLYGVEGQGRVAALGLQEAVFASVHPCGKAVGMAGAFVCGSGDLRDWLINAARSFVFSTAPAPFLAAGLDAALALLQGDAALRRRPLELAVRLRARLAGRVDTGASASAIVPLIVGDERRALDLAAGLRSRGWDLRAVRPPTVPPGACRVRVVVHAAMDEAQIDALAEDILDGVGR